MSMNDFLNMLNDEQKQALLDALLSDSVTIKSVPEEVNKESIKTIQESLPASTANVKEDFTMNRQISNVRRKEPVKGRHNKWEDTGEDRNVETPHFERSPRKREPYKKVEVECHVCGKTFKEDPRCVGGEYYRCNRCTGT